MAKSKSRGSQQTRENGDQKKKSTQDSKTQNFEIDQKSKKKVKRYRQEVSKALQRAQPPNSKFGSESAALAEPRVLSSHPPDFDLLTTAQFFYEKGVKVLPDYSGDTNRSPSSSPPPSVRKPKSKERKSADRKTKTDEMPREKDHL